MRCKSIMQKKGRLSEKKKNNAEEKITKENTNPYDINDKMNEIKVRFIVNSVNRI